ncbi:MAG: nitroreductase [Jhaorihella sp.]
MTPDLIQLDALLRRRHSCRAFRPDQVPRETIERIVTTAGRAPSWCNSQPWQLTITSGAETERLRTALMQQAHAGVPRPDIAFPTRYSGVYQDRRRDCGWSLYKAVGVEKGDRAASARQAAQNFALFGAPHCAILSSPADLGPYGVLDCGGFITAFTLAAEALGVASIPQAAVAGFAPFLHGHFAIPDDRQILCGIAFGFSDTDHPANSFRTGRATLDEIADWRG